MARWCSEPAAHGSECHEYGTHRVDPSGVNGVETVQRLTKGGTMPTYKFSENNSGGSWWLGRKQYEALMAAGWRYEADAYDKERGHDTKPFFGKDDDVPYGWRHNLKGDFATIKEAVESFERATGEDFFALGCTCCGAPFSMSTDDYTEYLSGGSVEHTPQRPW